MINILLVEDNQHKAKKIISVLNSFSECKTELATDLVTARKHLTDYFDLLILDINLPERWDEDPIESKGLEFIKELQSSRRLKLPGSIIGLTEFENLYERFEKNFKEEALILIQYDVTSNAWENTLKIKIEYLISSSFYKDRLLEYDYDIAFITALRSPEFEALLELDYNWKKLRVINDSSIYYSGSLKLSNGKCLKIIGTYQPQMGMIATATACSKLINLFRPKFLIMIGICAGISSRVNLGDLIICDLAFDMGSGKIVDVNGTQTFQPDFQSIPISVNIKENLIDLSQNRNVLHKIKESWKGERQALELNAFLGPVGSGSSVIAEKKFLENIINHQRKLLGIDMETYAVFYSCEYFGNPKPVPISIKSVADFADESKNDKIQKYCSFLSSQFADHIIKYLLFEF